MMELASYGGLFVTAFLAVTVLPFQGDVVMLALYAAGYKPALLLPIVTIGNTLGSIPLWLIGRFIERFRGKRWFPVKEAALKKGQERYQRYGSWSLLASPVPIMGDALCIAGGLMRVSLPVFLLLGLVGRGLRFAMVLGAAAGLTGLFAT
jgi:membrane protein YqaA with SNARE-associated domain